VDGHHFEIAAPLVYELDENGKQLRVVKYTDYSAEMVRTLYPSAAELRDKVEALKAFHGATASQLNAVVPKVLDAAFAGRK
jgi:hypothetical protein